MARSGISHMSLSQALAFLKQKDHTMKMIGLEIIKNSKENEKTFEPVKELLHDESPDVRSFAAEVLIGIAPQDALPFIIELLKDPISSVRLNILNILEKYPTSKYIPSIKECIYDREMKVRKAALRALAATKDSGILDSLLNALRDTNEIIFDEATKILANYKGSVPESLVSIYLGDENAEVRLAVLQYLIPQLSETNPDFYIQALEDESPEVKKIALLHLQDLISSGVIKDKIDIFTELALKLINDPVKSVRFQAINLLGVLKNPDTLEPLIKVATNDEDEDVRALAMETIVIIRRALRIN